VVTDNPIDEDGGKLVLGAISANEVSVMPEGHADRHAQGSIRPVSPNEALFEHMLFWAWP
jgi:hypothetical protein